VNAVTGRRGNHSTNGSRFAGGQLEGGRAALPSGPEWGREQPDLHSSTRIGMGQLGGEARVSAVGRHRRSAPGVDALWAHSGAVQDRTITVPNPRLFDDRAAGGLTGDTQLAGLEALLSSSVPVLEKRLAAMPGIDEQEPEPYTAPSSHRRCAPVTGVKIIALIPAYNEEAQIASALESVLGQSRPPDRILVVTNNTTDRTAEVALSFPGVDVMDIPQCAGRKAGALNQALDAVLPDLKSDDLVLCMDADVTVDYNFLRNAERHFLRDPELGGVSSNHGVEFKGNLLERLQALEFARDRRYMGRKHGNAGCCMSGQGTLFKVSALRRVEAKEGQIFVPDAWTEDWMLTFALKHLRIKLLKPADCIVTTAPVLSLGLLYIQRQRWGRGYFEAIARYGFTRVTAVPWLSTGLWAVSTLLWAGWMAVIAHSVLAGHVHFAWWVIPVTGLCLASRIVTVKRLGWKAMLLAASTIPDMLFAYWVTAATAVGIVKHLSGRQGRWGEVRGRRGRTGEEKCMARSI